MPTRPFSDPALEWVSISDFTPGIYRFSRVSTATTYTPNAPLGSASVAYRCVAREGYGLTPLPRYVLVQTHTATDAAQPVCLSMGNMLSLAARGGPVGDLVCAMLVQHGHPEVRTDFNVTRLPLYLANVPAGWPNPPYVPFTVYSNSTTTLVGPSPGYAWPFNTTSWPMMDFASFRDTTTSLYARTVITTDPIATSLALSTTGKWVSVRGWTTPSGTGPPESSNGTFSLLGAIGSYPRIFYHATRMGIWQVGSAQTATNGFVATDNDVLYLSDSYTPNNITSAGTFFPEMGTFISTWGSISTGEFVGIYNEGGAILIYGSLFAPDQIIKIPGVAGTMGMMSRAALTNIGLIYPRFNEGAWVWNGDNTSTKISSQIPDDLFDRTKQSQGFQASPIIQTSMAKLGPYVLFPGNWLFNTLTKSWWTIEDTTVNNFQVWCANDTQWLFGSPGIAYANAGQTATLNTYGWDFGTASQSYRWVSSPLPVSQDSLVSIQLIELVATNQTNVACTVTITPTVPTGQRALQQQNPTQPLVFTIPAFTVAYRASQRLGYADYNIQLQVDATNTNANNAAPVIHQINVGYTSTRVAGVQ